MPRLLLTCAAMLAACAAEEPVPLGTFHLVGPAERPAQLFVPTLDDSAAALPLVVVLHGYSSNAEALASGWGLFAVAQ
ncbi:MAG: hypothetical protein JNG84_03900 [Archangium sp.]|nr:hypothetical protein [Archangium sp.]